MLVYLTNAFSLNMLSHDYHELTLLPLTPADAAALLYVLEPAVVNAIGHPNTHTLVEQTLKAELPALELPEPQRLTVRLAIYDAAIVAQYTGPRLEAGATVLPSDAQLSFWLVMEASRVRGPVVEELVEAYATEWQKYESQTMPSQTQYIHWAALTAMKARAAELRPRAADVLEALRQAAVLFPI